MLDLTESPALLLQERTPSGFGGSWTSEKLEKIERYHKAYLKVLKNIQYLKPIYIDAFAGTGYCDLGRGDEGEFLFPEMADESTERFIQGSAVRALNLNPGYSRYLFIEKSARHAAELAERVRESGKESISRIIKADANTALLQLCKKFNWISHRAVVFLDPFGMQVKWSALEAIAKTEAIDLWYLFPMGVGVNRLLKNDGKIAADHQRILDEMFGARDWREHFYSPSPQADLFGAEAPLIKTADFDRIEAYFVSRLKSIFPKVAENPARLSNSKGNPLYLLCFASANTGRGGDTALRIAKHILKM